MSASKSMKPGSVTKSTAASSLREQVEAVIAASILTGEIPADSIVSVPTLAARFEVSATPVREAMLNLEKQGFVEAKRNRGFRVTSVGRQDLEEIAFVRQLLEPPAMVRLAAILDPARLGELRELADRIVGAVDASDLTSYLKADQRFHLRLLEELGNQKLVEIVRDLRAQTRLVGLVNLVETDELMTSAREHHQLVDFLAAGDGVAAGELMARHVRHFLGWWAGLPEADTGPHS
jgi:DNA-binding GntR family transcriptional regulator